MNQLSAQSTAKKVTLVLDDSGSMRGAKYESVNYALQLLTALLEPEDRLFIVRGGQLLPVSLDDKQSSINTIAGWTRTGSGDYTLLPPAIDELNKNEDFQNWMIITADGMWGPTDGIQEYFKHFYSTSKPYIKFLSINRLNDNPDENSLKTLLSDYPLVDVLEARAEVNQELVGHLEKIAAEVVSVSGKTVRHEKRTDNSISFTPEIPLKKCIVLYQDNQPVNDLPKATKAEVTGTDIALAETFDASNFNINAGQSLETKLSGRIHTINSEGGDIIPAGKEIKITFDKTISSDKIKIIPISAVKLSAFPSGKFQSVNSDKTEYTVCKDVENIVVNAELMDLDGNPLSKEILGKIKVLTQFGMDEKKLRLQDGKFSVEVPLKSDEVTFSVRADYDGYFDFRSRIFTIKKKECVADLPPKDIPGLLIIFPTASKSELGDSDKGFSGRLSLPDGTPVHPDDYDLEFEEAPSRVDFISTLNDSGNGWNVIRDVFTCSCLVESGKQEGHFILRTKNNGLQSLKGKWMFEVTDEGPLEGCVHCILYILGAIVLLIYIFGLVRKKRFPKGAIIEYKREFLDYERETKPRIQELPTGFFSRYLVPFVPEKKEAFGITFVASGTSSYIMLPKKAQSKDMFNRGRPFRKPGEKDEMIRAKTRFEVRRRNRIEIYTYK